MRARRSKAEIHKWDDNAGLSTMLDADVCNEGLDALLYRRRRPSYTATLITNFKPSPPQK